MYLLKIFYFAFQFSKGKTNKKTKRVSFIGISNGSVEKKTKSISKSHYLKNISNIIEMKGKKDIKITYYLHLKKIRYVLLQQLLKPT